MDAPDLMPLLEQLEDNVDDLEEVLEPVLGQSLAKLSKNLPVMDRAKIHVLITYTLESLIFSYLRLKGVDAKQHPVFRELTRVRQYFEKIKALETEPEQPTMKLDKAAAGRFIKHGLAGNNKIDLELAEKQAKERARAQLKAAMLAKKSAAKEAAQDSAATSSAVTSSAQETGDSDDDDEEMEEDMAKEEKQIESKSKRSKKDKSKKGLSKAERRDEKKQRRQKKEDARKARKGQ
ncbi:Sas10/Utp3/C1D [Penicillium cosmopolitanum]|uniref:Exosome complex protein n=1 Tax=Penicillium cosmopolitanum TaxID=1131564 RepID=A0A9W9W1T5_9EURO|nr:Sas10/Utp3/C1D [Penicillium cosmopolitanum]KAJ5397118.1 Sas10/Utp3/C1D [Penicillium cosmopolitanum]